MLVCWQNTAENVTASLLGVIIQSLATPHPPVTSDFMAQGRRRKLPPAEDASLFTLCNYN